MPKFCAANSVDRCICSFLDQFANEPFIFFAEILGTDPATSADGAGFSNEAIRLSHMRTVAWFLRFR